MQSVRLLTRAARRVSAALSVGMLLAPAHAAPAPAQDPPPQPAAVAPAGNAAAILMNINDLGLLKALQPVKLTGEQVTALVPVLREVADQGKALLRQDEEALRAIATDVEKARSAALAGTPVPADLEARVEATAKAAEARRKKARTAAVGRIVGALKTGLTPEQLTGIAARVEKVLGGKLVPPQYKQTPSKAPREAVQDLAVAYFVEQVLLNERAVDVVSQMKPPPSAAEAPAAAAAP